MPTKNRRAKLEDGSMNNLNVERVMDQDRNKRDVIVIED